MNWTDATTVTQLAEHRFRAHVDDQWTSLQGVHGGVVAAIAVNASSTVLRDEGDDPAAQLRAATFGYVSGNTVALDNWKFLDGLEFTFPAGTSLGAGQLLLLVDQDPNTFRSTYNVPVGVQIFQYVGALSNGFLVEFMDWAPPDLFEELPECKDGLLRIPDRPGHGMALSPKAFEKYRA